MIVGWGWVRLESEDVEEEEAGRHHGHGGEGGRGELVVELDLLGLPGAHLLLLVLGAARDDVRWGRLWVVATLSEVGVQRWKDLCAVLLYVDLKPWLGHEENVLGPL